MNEDDGLSSDDDLWWDGYVTGCLSIVDPEHDFPVVAFGPFYRGYLMAQEDMRETLVDMKL